MAAPHARVQLRLMKIPVPGVGGERTTHARSAASTNVSRYHDRTGRYLPALTAIAAVPSAGRFDCLPGCRLQDAGDADGIVERSK